MSVISIQDATFSYDGKAEIFSHLTCDIETDQIFCILGPNGIGKSTLLKGIMNLHPLLNGQVQLDGKDIRSYDTKELAKKIAYIPQTYQLVFPYQVLDLILMGRTPHLNSMNPVSYTHLPFLSVRTFDRWEMADPHGRWIYHFPP